MGAINSAQWQWQFTLTKTQEYLRNRIIGNGCERDQLEAWRQFYRTNEPIVRLMVSKSGVTANVSVCVEEVWLDLIANLNTLRLPQTHDSFLYWLKNLVRRNTLQFRTMPSESAQYDAKSQLTDDENSDEETSLNDRLLHLRLVEAQPVERVARTLGITCQQVIERQRRILKRILLILIQLDIAPANS